MSKTFLYFAYGSNMLKQRIHINNPSAVRKNIGCLKNFRLDFATYSERWHGCSATIVPMNDSHVWGVVWELAASNIATLDAQEGVADQIYFAHTVDVHTPEGEIMNCRVYQQCKQPAKHTELHALESERRPSPLYIDTIVKGAIENKLPEDYIKFLKRVPHNGYEGEYDIRNENRSLRINQERLYRSGNLFLLSLLILMLVSFFLFYSLLIVLKRMQ